MADNQIFIPETPAELTGTWLASALAGFNSPAPIIDHVAQEVLGEGEGFMGDLLRLTPVYSQGGENYPVTLIAKLPKLANRTMGSEWLVEPDIALVTIFQILSYLEP